MSKIAEQKALEEYPKETYYDRDVCDYIDVNATRRDGYIKGYDQAMQDMVKDSDYLKYLSDNEGYAYACGCRKTMQDLSEKAIIAYCGVCKMPNCVMQNQKEICPYLSKFRRCLESLLNN